MHIPSADTYVGNACYSSRIRVGSVSIAGSYGSIGAGLSSRLFGLGTSIYVPDPGCDVVRLGIYKTQCSNRHAVDISVETHFVPCDPPSSVMDFATTAVLSSLILILVFSSVLLGFAFPIQCKVSSSHAGWPTADLEPTHSSKQLQEVGHHDPAVIFAIATASLSLLFGIAGLVWLCFMLIDEKGTAGFDMWWRTIPLSTLLLATLWVGEWRRGTRLGIFEGLTMFEVQVWLLSPGGRVNRLSTSFYRRVSKL